jgi:hypothetical protein
MRPFTIYFGLILGFILDGVIHSFVTSLPVAIFGLGIIQRIPENRKLPYLASVYYFTYGQAEEG